MQCAAQFVVVIVTCAYIYYLLHGTLLSGHGVYCGKSKGKIINSKDYNLSGLKISQVNCKQHAAVGGCWLNNLKILLRYKSKQGWYSIKKDTSLRSFAIAIAICPIQIQSWCDDMLCCWLQCRSFRQLRAGQRSAWLVGRNVRSGTVDGGGDRTRLLQIQIPHTQHIQWQHHASSLQLYHHWGKFGLALVSCLLHYGTLDTRHGCKSFRLVP